MVNIKLSKDWTIADELPNGIGPFTAIQAFSPVPLIVSFDVDTQSWHQLFQKKLKSGEIILEATLVEGKILAYRSINGIRIEPEDENSEDLG